MRNVVYKTGIIPPVEKIINLYVSSELKRPVDDKRRIEAMYRNSNLIVSGWHNEQLIGIARSLTDFNYACYLSDLAVLKDWQGAGIGKSLIDHIQKTIGGSCNLVLLASATAMSYYEHLGIKKVNNGFIIERLY